MIGCQVATTLKCDRCVGVVATDRRPELGSLTGKRQRSGWSWPEKARWEEPEELTRCGSIERLVGLEGVSLLDGRVIRT